MSSVTTVLMPASSANALTTSDSKSADPDWQIQSLLLYRAIGYCFANSGLSAGDNVTNGGRINSADVSTGKWFGFGSGQDHIRAAPIGVYLKDLTDVGSDGQVNCDQTSFVTAALKLWDVDAATLLCNSGLQRVDRGSKQSLSDCVSGTTQLERTAGGSNGGWPDGAAKFSSYIKKTIYGGSNPDLLPPEWYLFYRTTLARSCIPDIATVSKVSSTPKASDDLYGFNGVKVVDIKNNAVVTGSLTGALKKTDNIVTRPGDAPDYSSVTLSCQDTVTRMNNYAPQYLQWAALNQQPAQLFESATAGIKDGAGSNNGSSCVIEGIGWLVCAAMNGISGLVDGLYKLIEGILTINPLQQNNSDGKASAQYVTWQNIRNIANVLLVIGFLLIIFSQLTSFGVSNYGIKKMLPRIIIVAIAINLSYFVMGLAIDITNILGSGIKTILDTTGADASLSSVGFENITTAYLAGSTAAITVATIGPVAVGAAGLSASTLALLVLPFLLGAFLAVLAAFATMFIRNALIIVLVVISPVAFAAYLLPNTQSLFDRWRKLFISMLALFPLAALLFGGAKLAAYITLSSGQPFAVIIALFIMAAPLGALPFLIKSSNSLLSGINNKLQSAAKSARTASQRGLKPFVDKQKAQYQAGQRNFFGRRQQPGSRRNLAQGFDQRRRSRALETQNAGTEAEENWKTAGVAGTGGAGRRAQRALDTQKTLGTRKSANEAQIDERSKRRIADPSTVDAAYERQTFDAQMGSKTSEAVTKQRNLERVQANAVSTSAAAGGERLGNIDRQHFGSEEAAKTLDMQIKRANMESGVAAGSVQAQKTAELGIKAVDAHEQAAFDVSIPHNNDTIASTQQLDEATRVSGTATAEMKKSLAEQAQMTPELAELDQRKRAAEDATSLIEKTEQAEYTENRDAALATETRVANSQTQAAERIQEQAYAQQLQSDAALAQRAGGIDPQGETLVVAQAIETQRKAYDSNVAAYGVRLRQAGKPDSLAGTLGRDDRAGDDSLLGIAMDTRRTAEEREAAGRAVVAAGNIDAIVPYQNYLATALQSTPLNTPEFTAVQALQKAYGDTVSSSPGKPMGLSMADIAQFKTGTYTPPIPTIKRPIRMVDLSVSDVQTLNTVNDKGVSMDGWASMDKADIARVTDLVQRGLIPQERLDTMWESLNTAMSDVRWYGRIKEREQNYLEDLIKVDPATGTSLIPAPGGKTRKTRK